MLKKESGIVAHSNQFTCVDSVLVLRYNRGTVGEVDVIKD